MLPQMLHESDTPPVLAGRCNSAVRRARAGASVIFGRLGLWLVVAAAGQAVPGAAAAPEPLVLPMPSGAPQSIDFARDPLVLFDRAAGPSQPFLELVGHAVEVHPAVGVAIASAQASAAVRVQVRAGLFPQIDAALVGDRALARDFGDRTAIVESLRVRGRTDAVVTGEQLIYDFGATGNRIAAANERILAARAEVERVADETALQAVAAWYNVLAYQTLVDLAGAMAARQRDILGDVRSRLAQGLGAGGDVARAEAVLADSEAAAARYERLLAQARARYREAFGTDAPPRLSRSLPPASAAQSLDAATMLAEKSPVVVAARRRAEAARRDWRAAKADGLPRLTAGINGSRYDVFTGSDYEVRGNFALRQSLFAGGRQRGVIAEAGAQARGAGFNADQIAAATERDAAAAFTDVAALSRSTAALGTAYAANRRVRDGYVEQFRVSRGSLIELLRAEEDYFNAAAAYLQGVVELDIARYTLLARTGEMLPVIGIKLVI